MRKIFALPFRLVTPMFAFCLMAAPLAAQQITETFSHNADSFQMQFVKIGDVGNSGKNVGLSRPIGDVNYEYWMGKFEVDAWQIAVGNASQIVGVSVADWNHRGYTFGTNPPATGISWQEAARFVNWMNISKGYSPAYKFASYGPFNSYDPTYTGLNDMMMLWDPNDVGYNPNNPFRNSRARYFLPSIDEWFKAAFYDPTLNGGNGGYWNFATTSDTAPTPVPGGAAGAIYDFQTGPANVDNAGSLSWYGTMAQGGNVWELAETAFDLNNNDINKNRAVVGGGWESPATEISSDFMLSQTPSMISQTPSAPNDSYGIGFRVAMVVEPDDSDLDQDGVIYYRELKDGTDPNDPNSFNPLSIGLVAFYNFDQNLADESGYGRDLNQVTNIQQVPDFRSSQGQSLRLPSSTGSDARSSVTSGLSGNMPRSVSFWFYSDGPQPWPSGNIVMVAGDATSTGPTSRVAIDRGEGTIQIDNGSGREARTVPVPNLHQRVHHFVWTYQDNLTNSKFYLNGNLLAAGAIDNATLDGLGEYPVRIGDLNNRGFAGKLDDLRVYKRVLTAEEVRQVYTLEAQKLDTDQDGLIDAVEFRLEDLGFDRFVIQDAPKVQSIFSNPNFAGLYTQPQYDGSYTNGRTQGRLDVTSNPGAYGLFNEDSLADVNLGGVVMRKLGNTVNLEVQVQTTPDIKSQSFTDLPYKHLLYIDGLPTDKAFLRVRALGPQ